MSENLAAKLSWMPVLFGMLMCVTCSVTVSDFATACTEPTSMHSRRA